MRYLSCAALAVAWSLGCAVASRAQSRAEPPSPVALTVEVVGQKYCAINAGNASLQMRLRLRYTNAGGRKLILYRGQDLFYQTKFRRGEAGGARPYEVTFLHASWPGGDSEAVEQPSPGRAFVIINPGGTYERELEVNVGVVDDEARRGNQAVAEGEHRFHLVISTWYRSRPLALKLRQQWERKGLLWIDPLVSAPLSLTVKKPAAQPPCG